MYTNMSVCHKQKIIYVFLEQLLQSFFYKWRWSCGWYFYVSYSTSCSIFSQVSILHDRDSLTEDLESWTFFSPIDFPLTFIIFYGSNISKNPQCFRQRHFVEKKHFIFDNQEQLYPLSSSSPVASVMERATNNQMTVSTLKSVKPLLCLLLKAYLWW